MESEPLAKACELAFAVARQGVEANPPIEPPVAMRSFLYVPQLPRRAMTVAQRVVDEDPAFRARVAAQATEVNVGRDGYLWLHRPTGWDSDPSFGQSEVTQLVTGQTVARSAAGLPDMSRHTGQSVLEPVESAPAPSHQVTATPQPAAPVPPPTPPTGAVASTGSIPPPPPPPAPSDLGVSASDAGAAPSDAAPSGTPTSGTPTSEAKASIEEELASLRGLVSRLAEERQNVIAPVAGLETEVEERRAESNALATQLTSANSDLQKVRDERNRALADREEMLSRQAELEAELRGLRSEIEQSRSAIAGAEADRSSTLTTLEQAQAELRDAQRSIDTAAETEAGLRTQLDAAVAERDAAWRDASALRVERDQLSDRVRVAEQARVDLEAQLDEMSGQWQDLKIEIQTLAEERRAVETALDELARTRETGAAERRSLFNELASQLGQVEAERDHLAAQIDIMRARITGTRSALDMATHSLTGELDSAASAATDSVAAVDSLDGSLGLVHERLASLGSAIDSDAGAASGRDVAPSAVTGDAEPTPGDEPTITPPMPPMSPSSMTPPSMTPGSAAGEVGIEGFLPEGVDIDVAPGRPESTLFGNPRDVAETHLFGDPPSPPAPYTDDDVTEDAPTPEAVLDESADVAADDQVDAEFVDAEFVDVGSADDTPETDDQVDAVDPEPVDDRFDASVLLEGRSSADDDQALANVMASYGFGADDDDDQLVSGDAIASTTPADDVPAFEVSTDDTAYGDTSYGDTSNDAESEMTFDPSDTSSFIDPATAIYEAPVAEAAPVPGLPDDTEARRIASTPDLVMLIDGDAAATMGWRDSAIVDRRRYLLEKLDQVTGEYGPAVDVVFDPAVGGEDQMPAPTKVRRRLIQRGTSPSQKLSELVDSYPSHFPIAVVSDQVDLKAEMRLRSIDTLDVVQLLDLIVNLPAVD